MDLTGQLASLIVRRLGEARDDARQQWVSPVGTPTRHFVVDDLLPEDQIAQISGEFPRHEADWHQRDSFRERKKTFARLDEVAPMIGAVTDAFQRPPVIELVGQITGIAGLEADPGLYAGGISMMGRGDFLNPHLDNSHDAGRQRYRRLNLLYYVSPEWTTECGGNFELWDAAVTEPTEVVSKQNRLLVMETNRGSWHSVNPVRVDRNRCCVSNYYFAASSPTGEDYYHVTSFLGRPGQRWQRVYGRVDNALRQTVATVLRVSRGKRLGRYG